MVRKLLKDYGRHRAGSACPPADPVRLAWLVEHGYLAGDGAAVEPVAEGWPLATAPAAYLDRHPRGPHAALAREIVGEPVEEIAETADDPDTTETADAAEEE